MATKKSFKKTADLIAKFIDKLIELQDELDVLILARNNLIEELFNMDEAKDENGIPPKEITHTYNGNVYSIQRKISAHYDEETFMAVYEDLAKELKATDIKKLQEKWKPSQAEIKALFQAKNMLKELEELEDEQKPIYVGMRKVE